MTLVMIPRMFTSGNAEILEEVCVLLKNAKVEDEFYKYELVLQMRCMVHKYAETLEDIIRLEGVIGLKNVCIGLQQRDQALINRTRVEALMEGNFEMALKFKDIFGIDAIVENTDFSREELESGKLNR